MGQPGMKELLLRATQQKGAAFAIRDRVDFPGGQFHQAPLRGEQRIDQPGNFVGPLEGCD